MNWEEKLTSCSQAGQRMSSFFGVVEHVRTEDNWKICPHSSLWTLSFLPVPKSLLLVTGKTSHCVELGRRLQGKWFVHAI
ncbi:unnamed protein product [Lathyrus oleraceus]